MRVISIANTKTQKRYNIESNATTLGELMDQMTAQGIDYEGMSFTEGISKTQLLSRDSLLPTNVMYKGQPTNNLVMLLTNTQKNIASGMGTRKEAYEIIKANNLGDAIKETLGKNYTVVTTVNLWNIIDKLTCTCAMPDVEETPAKKEEVVATHTSMVNFIYDGIKLLVDEGQLFANDVAVISELTEELYNRLSESEPGFSDEDIEDMINSL